MINKNEAPEGSIAVKEEVESKCDGCCFSMCESSSSCSHAGRNVRGISCDSDLRDDGHAVIFKELTAAQGEGS